MQYKTKSASRYISLILWLFQGILWLLVIMLTLYFVTAEAPGVRALYKDGIEDSFNGLSGIIAESSPSWSVASKIQGFGVGKSYSELQGDRSFTVKIVNDGNLIWISGLATLAYDINEKLLWVRRLDAPQNGGFFVKNYVTDEVIPVISASPPTPRQPALGNAGAE